MNDFLDGFAEIQKQKSKSTSKPKSIKRKQNFSQYKQGNISSNIENNLVNQKSALRSTKEIDPNDPTKVYYASLGFRVTEPLNGGYDNE